MPSSFSYIAFFDVDHTLIPYNSGARLVRSAYAKKLMGTADLLHALYLAFLYKTRLRKVERILDGMTAWLKGIRETDMVSLSEATFHSCLSKAVRPEMYQVIRYHKEQQARLVILSSALSYICQPFARHLGMDDVICSEMEVHDGRFTGTPAGQLCYGEEKRNRLISYCEKMNSPAGKAYYYADDYSDLSALGSVGHPVCVNPGRRLAREAAARNWTITRWHQVSELRHRKGPIQESPAS